MKQQNRFFKYYLSVCSLFIIACCPKDHKIFNGQNIYGSWYLHSSLINYPELTFSVDSIAIFKSRGDTVYRFRFYTKNDTLFLTDFFKKRATAKILTLSQDSLIFETLLENNSIQRYSRE
jgi:hypothetical protein